MLVLFCATTLDEIGEALGRIGDARAPSAALGALRQALGSRAASAKGCRRAIAGVKSSVTTTSAAPVAASCAALAAWS